MANPAGNYLGGRASARFRAYNENPGWEASHMPFPSLPAIEILKNTNWQKEKGKFAKVFGGKTGIGEQMNKLKGVYDKLDLLKLDAANTYKTIDEANNAVNLCKAEYAKTEPLRKEAYALRDLANKTAETFKKNKLIPAATVTLLQNIAKAADLYGVTVKSYDPTEEFKAAVLRTQQNIARLDDAAKNAIKIAAPKCDAELKKVKTAKPPVYTNEAWQAVRAYAAAVAKWPKLASVQPQWKTLSSKTIGDVKGDLVLPHVAALEKLLVTTNALVV